MTAFRGRSTYLHPYRGFYASGQELDQSRLLFGKPLRWTRGWVVVLAILMVSGVLLLSARLQMGSLAVWSERETQAVRLVMDYRPTGDQTVGQIITTAAGAHAGRWYAFDRSWERRVYVVWQWGDVVLSFTVHESKVTPDRYTRVLLRMDDAPQAGGPVETQP